MGVEFHAGTNDDKSTNMSSRVEKCFEELDGFSSIPFLLEREQPTTPERQIFNDSNGD
jgi:hypothetical protein